MIIADVAAKLAEIAPPEYAESWDNVGLLLGDPARPCCRVLLCIDLTESVLAEAIAEKADLVMAYHPVIFKALPRVTPVACPVAYGALHAKLAVYSVHTAFDSVIGGANDGLADSLGMSGQRRPLSPRQEDGPYKIVVFVPADNLPAVSGAAFAAGAGRIGLYSDCGFGVPGTGTFVCGDASRPAIGRPGQRVAAEEVRWEVQCPRPELPAVLAAIQAAHCYETPAIDVCPLADAPVGVGLGRVGTLRRPTSMRAMLNRVRKACGVRRIQLAGPGVDAPDRPVGVLAVGCGSCGSLFRQAIAGGADLYVTGELRHHDALAAAAAGLTVACVGHSNSERLTLDSLARRLQAALPGLEVALANTDRDPLHVV